VWGDGWHPGVIGIIASRIAENYGRPAIVVSFDGQKGRGSGRSVPGFHMYDALRECSHLLERFGGHRMAAGLSVHRDRVEALRDAIREVATRELAETSLADVLNIDLNVSVSEAPELYRSLRYAGPFGTENPTPVLLAGGVNFRKISRVGPEGAHLRLQVEGPDGATLPAIGFRMGRRQAEARSGGPFDAVFELGERSWKGRTEIQARLRDFRTSG
jgi:single-stranded-DNA-specific exonuclease